MSVYFITGTGTDIGKTWLAAALVRRWRGRGLEVRAYKPVMSGFGADIEKSDAAVLLHALGEPVTDEGIARIAPWRFAAPLSPDMAAEREGRSIDFDRLVSWCRGAVAGQADVALVEGVGGCMVPLDRAHTVLDWMAALALPAVVVGGSYLGALSHCLTALAALKAARVPVAALVINETVDSTVPLGDTLRALAAHAPGTNLYGVARATPDAALDSLQAFLVPSS